MFQEMFILKVPKLVVDLDLDLEKAKGILMMKMKAKKRKIKKALDLDYHHLALEEKGREKLMLKFQMQTLM